MVKYHIYEFNNWRPYKDYFIESDGAIDLGWVEVPSNVTVVSIDGTDGISRTASIVPEALDTGWRFKPSKTDNS